MKTVQVVKNGTNKIITSFTEYEDGIKGITADGYSVYVDGEKLKQERKENTMTNEEAIEDLKTITLQELGL